MAVVAHPPSHHSFSTQSVKRKRLKLSKFFGETPPIELVSINDIHRSSTSSNENRNSFSSIESSSKWSL